MSKLTYPKAIQEYEKLRYVTNYGEFYGRKPALTDLSDTLVLRTQKFSDLQCSRILNENVKECLDNWQAIQKEDSFKGLVLGTLRSLYTFVKNTEPSNSTNRVAHK